MSFETRVAILSRLGIEFSQLDEYRGKVSRKPVGIEVFHSVLLPLEPIEWLSLCMKMGINYVGGCCGAMSALQDQIEHIFRFDSGWASGRDLSEMAQVIIEHDDFDGKVPWGKLPEPIEEFAAGIKLDELDVWSKIALCWHLVEGYYSAEVPQGHSPKCSEVQQAIAVLGDALYYLSTCDFFKNSEGPPSQEKTNRAVILSRILPALRVLNSNIDELDLGSIEGFALVDTDKGPDVVASNGFGYCVYTTQEETRELLKTWIREAEEYQEDERRKNSYKRIQIRPVRVTKERGIEFTD